MSPLPTFIIHAYEGADAEGRGWGPPKAELERRGFPCRIVRSPRVRTTTPNQDRARALVDALADESGDVALLGISNQGLFMPLVAAARPVRRIVFINAVIPFPGTSFIEATKDEKVWTNWITRWFARRAPGMNEVCPLTALPRVDAVYISAEKDEAIRPAWEQQAARDLLHVEPVVIRGAGHSSVLKHATELVDAATAGLSGGR